MIFQEAVSSIGSNSEFARTKKTPTSGEAKADVGALNIL